MEFDNYQDVGDCKNQSGISAKISKSDGLEKEISELRKEVARIPEKIKQATCKHNFVRYGCAGDGGETACCRCGLRL